jgi:hypothetical protein
MIIQYAYCCISEYSQQIHEKHALFLQDATVSWIGIFYLEETTEQHRESKHEPGCVAEQGLKLLANGFTHV